MNKRNLNRLLFALLFLMIGSISPTQAALLKPITDSIPNLEDARAKVLVGRLEEIKGTDKSTLSKNEKKELRKETKDIKKEMKSMSNGVYISIGALIIIILLLILIL